MMGETGTLARREAGTTITLVLQVGGGAMRSPDRMAGMDDIYAGRQANSPTVVVPLGRPRIESDA